MKNVLKTKMVSILLIYVSIDFIYSGCGSCRPRGYNGDNKGGGGKSSSKTNLTGSQWDKEGNPEKIPLGPQEIKEIKLDSEVVKELVEKKVTISSSDKVNNDKSSSHVDDNDDVTHIEGSGGASDKDSAGEPKEKAKLSIGNIRNVLSGYMNNRSGSKRDGITEQWKICNWDDNVTRMTFGRITVSISDEQIITITDISDMSQFDNLVVTISVERAKDVKFCFYDDGRCELRDLIKSLTVLDSRYRGFDKTEYLCLDKLKDFEHDYDAFYLNLSNGVLYVTEKENSVFLL